jgi:hypothetical protein
MAALPISTCVNSRCPAHIYLISLRTQHAPSQTSIKMGSNLRTAWIRVSEPWNRIQTIVTRTRFVTRKVSRPQGSRRPTTTQSMVSILITRAAKHQRKAINHGARVSWSSTWMIRCPNMNRVRLKLSSTTRAPRSAKLSDPMHSRTLRPCLRRASLIQTIARLLLIVMRAVFH